MWLEKAEHRRRKQGQAAREGFGNVAWAWMDNVRKAKKFTWIELRLAGDVRSSESYCCDVSSKNRNKEKYWIIEKLRWSCKS